LRRVAPIKPDRLAASNAERRFSAYAMLCLIGAAILISSLIIAMTGVDGLRLELVLASFLMVSLWAGLLISALAQVIAIATPGRWRLQVRAAWIITAILIVGITIPAFELFKQLVLPARGFPLDPILASIDRAFFFGHDAWEVTHALFGSVGATLVIDRLYSFWMPMMFIFPAAAVMAVGDVPLRTRMIGTWLISWLVIACFGAWLFASAGPCYYVALIGPDAGFAELSRRLAQLNAAAHARGYTLAALDFQAMLLTGTRQHGLEAVGGISAMPSMHVAMAGLFAIAGRAHSRSLGWIMTAYAAGIWIGSVHLGWHYATDGAVGIAMMWAVWWGMGKFVARVASLPQAPSPDA
jgi:PAP2 superfamily